MFAATSELADPQKFGLYYGFSNLSMGIGGSLGNAVGGVLFSLGTAIGFPPLSWLILAGTGVLSTAAMRSLNLPYPVGSAIRASRMA
jgi:DHA1 family multidrug resistance protein-like MFS transporter